MDEHFYSLTELPNGYYEVEKTKQRTILNLPIHLGVFILNYAKLRMLEFYYDCVDKYLSREDFQYNEMDTDSAYMAIAGDRYIIVIPAFCISTQKIFDFSWGRSSKRIKIFRTAFLSM